MPNIDSLRKLQFVTTPSIHLATLLGTLGCNHLKKTIGPDKTNNGYPKVRWVFESTETADEAIALWTKPIIKLDWENIDRQNRAVAINLVSAFASNLKHYIGHTRDNA